jgi:hypothetical protein
LLLSFAKPNLLNLALPNLQKVNYFCFAKIKAWKIIFLAKLKKYQKFLPFFHFVKKMSTRGKGPCLEKKQKLKLGNEKKALKILFFCLERK